MTASEHLRMATRLLAAGLGLCAWLFVGFALFVTADGDCARLPWCESEGAAAWPIWTGEAAWWAWVATSLAALILAARLARRADA